MNSASRPESVPDDGVATDLTELMLQTRRIYLKKRQPRSNYVRALRKKLSGGIAKPVHMMLAVSISDLEDGAPLSLVLQPWYAAVGAIRVRAAEREARRGLSWAVRMNAAMLREIRVASKLGEARHRSAGNMDDMAAAMALRIALREYKAAAEEMEALLDERCAVDRLVA